MIAGFSFSGKYHDNTNPAINRLLSIIFFLVAVIIPFSFWTDFYIRWLFQLTFLFTLVLCVIFSFSFQRGRGFYPSKNIAQFFPFFVINLLLIGIFLGPSLHAITAKDFIDWGNIIYLYLGPAYFTGFFSARLSRGISQMLSRTSLI